MIADKRSKDHFVYRIIWGKKMFEKVKKILANRNYKTKNKYLIGRGANIGKGTRLNCKVKAFGTEPYLITVGENCLFADGVSVLNNLKKFGETKMDIIAPIIVGNNVYIGAEAFIMPGIKIGNNCVIGAKAIVTHDIPDNSVAVGIPAKVIKTIDEYYDGVVKKQNNYPTAGMSFQEKRAYFEKLNYLNDN